MVLVVATGSDAREVPPGRGRWLGSLSFPSAPGGRREADSVAYCRPENLTGYPVNLSDHQSLHKIGMLQLPNWCSET